MASKPKLPPATTPCPANIRGTRAGATWHRTTAREQACDDCLVAEREYIREYRAGKRTRTSQKRWTPKHRVQLPVELLAELYLTCPVEVSKKLDERYGAEQLDAWVQLYDQKETAA